MVDIGSDTARNFPGRRALELQSEGTIVAKQTHHAALQWQCLQFTGMCSAACSGNAAGSSAAGLEAPCQQ